MPTATRNTPMHPYQTLDDKSFWATAVAKRNMFDISDLWTPKFDIRPDMKVSTFGSCFAQHIGRALASRGFNWFIPEAAPQGLSDENAKRFNYGVFSARTGNIYTVSLLKQWVDWALGAAPVPDEVWVQDGRFYDPFRPNIEPQGFASPEELHRSREAAITAFRRCLQESSLFVFTLGLTESWFHSRLHHEYPMCPGTVAGEFREGEHRFVGQQFPFIRKTLAETLEKIRAVNPAIRFLLTVSPVPLTATMSGAHVLVATMESKSILRAVAGLLSRNIDGVDYFPSYEIINATPYRGTFFEANQRQVNSVGVNHVMDMFFEGLKKRSNVSDGTSPPSAALSPRPEAGGRQPSEDVVCEEALLEAFAASRKADAP